MLFVLSVFSSWLDNGAELGSCVPLAKHQCFVKKIRCAKGKRRTKNYTYTHIPYTEQNADDSSIGENNFGNVVGDGSETPENREEEGNIKKKVQY